MKRRFSFTLELIIIAALLLAGTLFLLRLAYMRIWVSIPLGLLYVTAVTWFVRLQYGLVIPLVLPVLAVTVDGLGNYFGWYRAKFSYVQFDEIAHALIPALTIPTVIWLLKSGIEYFGYRLPFGLIVFFALMTMFTISGFYEIIELWDDKYMHPEPGRRIHGAYDTPNDLQWNLIGMTVGALVTYAVMKRSGQRAG